MSDQKGYNPYARKQTPEERLDARSQPQPGQPQQGSSPSKGR